MIKKRKVSELTEEKSFVGLWVLGVNALNKSVKVSLEFIKAGYDDVVEATKKALASSKKADDAAKAAEEQADRAKQQADNPSMMGENGNWWKWDEATQSYVDTGILAKGGILYPTFYVDPDTMILYMAYQDEIVADQFVLIDGCLYFKAR